MMAFKMIRHEKKLKLKYLLSAIIREDASNGIDKQTLLHTKEITFSFS